MLPEHAGRQSLGAPPNPVSIRSRKLELAPSADRVTGPGNTPLFPPPAGSGDTALVLAATGMRLGEYLRCTPAHLVPAKYAIRVPGTKTKRSRRVIELGPEAWPWVEAGIPSPLKSRWIHIYWWRACVALGFGRYEQVIKNGVRQVKVIKHKDGTREERPVLRYTGLRLHDLRHVTGQVATDEGATTAQVGDALGHADYKTTARYQRRQHARLVGQKVSGALFRRRRTG